MSAKYVSTMYSEVFIHRRQLQITQEISELTKVKPLDYNLIRELLREYSRLEEWLEGIH